MRVCELHHARAVEILRSLKDGTEYDLCQLCLESLQGILAGTETTSNDLAKEPIGGRKRVPEAPNRAKTKIP